MSNSIIHSKSIAEINTVFGLDKPKHPLITLLDTQKLAYGEETVGKRFSSDLYCVALKDSSCGIDYGRNSYDFDNGVLIFTAPKQVITVKKPQALNEVKGWMLYFHTDLIRNMALGSKINTYNFFNYEVHEALHLSEDEQNTLNQIVQLIQTEINERIDNSKCWFQILNYCSITANDFTKDSSILVLQAIRILFPKLNHF